MAPAAADLDGVLGLPRVPVPDALAAVHHEAERVVHAQPVGPVLERIVTRRWAHAPPDDALNWARAAINVVLAAERPAVELAGLATERAIDAREWTVAREDAFRDGLGLEGVLELDLDDAPASTQPSIIGALANAARDDRLGEAGAARLLVDFAALWSRL